MNITKKLEKEIITYCELNNLDCDKFINNLLKKAFTLEKYGEKPEIFVKKEKVKKPKKEMAEKMEEKQMKIKKEETSTLEETKIKEKVSIKNEEAFQEKVVETEVPKVKLVKRRKLN